MRRSLREYHDSRRGATNRALMDALQLMQERRTERIPRDFLWSKRNWAKEAGVNKDTPLDKNPDGTFVYAEANAAYDRARYGRSRRRVSADQELIRALMEENRALKLVIHGRSGPPPPTLSLKF